MEKLWLEQSYDYDMHGNAALASDTILLGKPMLKQHADHVDEIVAIIAHELGHWKEWHALWKCVVDTAYMVLFGCVLMLFQNQASFLLAFGFHQPSYFVSLGLFIWLYSMTVDVPLRIGLNYFSRYLEMRADSFSVRLGFGVSQKNALVRSAAKNLDNLF